MAEEWYLLQKPHSQLSGYESEAIDEFGADGFAEVLESSVASDIELCNYDLSICKPMRAVIQNRLQDTKLKTLNRHMLVPVGTCKAGMYVKYKNRYWLITGVVDDNGVYEKAVMILCNYNLSWINDRGEVIQRWVNVTSASQYNNGEHANKNFTLRSDQLLILSPDDEECLMLDSGKRFIIDRRCRVYEKEFDETVQVNTDKTVIIYELTRSDGVFYDYLDSGCYEFMATQDEHRGDNDGYYVIDGKGYWLCGGITPKLDDKNNILSCNISCDSPEIYDGLEASVFVAQFFDADGKEIKVSPTWEIDCDFIDELDVEYIENSILISVDNEKLVNKTLTLYLTGDGYEKTSIAIKIKAFL